MSLKIQNKIVKNSYSFIGILRVKRSQFIHVINEALHEKHVMRFTRKSYKILQ